MDAGGNVYVTGDHASGSLRECSTVKYDSNGNLIWGYSLSGRCNAITVDGSGSVYIAGAYRSSPTAQPDYRVLKYSSGGSLLGNWTFGRSNFDMTTGIAVDGSGNIYVTGSSNNPSNPVQVDFLTYKLNSGGGQLWNAVYTAGTSYDNSKGIALDGSGNVYVTGSSLSDANGYCTMIKYNSSGAQQWVRTFSCVSGMGGYLAARGSGIYVAGNTDSGNVTIKYSASGNVVWTRSHGAFYLSAKALAAGANNDFYVAGTSYGNSTSYSDVAKFTDGLLLVNSFLPQGTVNTPYSQPLAASGGAPPYAWSVSSGSLSAGLTLNASTGTVAGTPTSAGTWSFSVKVTDALGANLAKAMTLAMVNLPPRAGFSATPLSGFGPLFVQFTDTSSNAPSSWSWNFGDGTLSSLPNPSHLFTAAGSYPVSLTVTNTFGSSTRTSLDYIGVASCGYTHPVLVSGALYSDVQAAYLGAADTDVIRMQALDFAGDLAFDRDIRATLKGGYDCGYQANPAATAFLGNFQVSNGTLKLENVRLR